MLGGRGRLGGGGALGGDTLGKEGDVQKSSRPGLAMARGRGSIRRSRASTCISRLSRQGSGVHPLPPATPTTRRYAYYACRHSCIPHMYTRPCLMSPAHVHLVPALQTDACAVEADVLQAVCTGGGGGGCTHLLM